MLNRALLGAAGERGRGGVAGAAGELVEHAA